MICIQQLSAPERRKREKNRKRTSWKRTGREGGKLHELTAQYSDETKREERAREKREIQRILEDSHLQRLTAEKMAPQ